MSTEFRVNVKIYFFIFFLARLPPQDSRLSNDFIRPRQHIAQNHQADLVVRLEVNDQLKLRGQLQPSALPASRR